MADDGGGRRRDAGAQCGRWHLAAPARGRAERQAQCAAFHAALAEKDALRQRDLATDQHQEAEGARQSLRRSLYASDMQLAEEAWESGDILRMRDLLEAHRPQPGMPDLRGFEWHYLRGLGTAVHITRLAQEADFGQLSPDGTHYVYVGMLFPPQGPDAGKKIELKLLDVASKHPVRKIVPFPGEWMSNVNVRLTFSPDGKRFLVTMNVGHRSYWYDWRIKVFDWETGRAVCTLADFVGVPGAATFDRSAKRLAAVISRPDDKAGSDLRIWDLDGGKPRRTIPLPGRQVVRLQHSVAFSPDGTRIAALTKPVGPEASRSAGEVRAWDAASGQERLRFETGPASAALAYSPDGKWLAEIGSGGASHRLRDAGSGKEVLELTTASSAGMSFSVAFSPDSSRLAGSSEDSKVRIWTITDVETGGGRAPDRVLDGRITMLTRVTWSADGQQVFASSDRGTVLSWPIAAREPHVAVKGSVLSDQVAATAAAPSSRFAAAFEAPDGKTELKVWDEAGRVLFTTDIAPAVHTRPFLNIKKVELSHDGTRVAYHGWEPGRADGNGRDVGRLRVWDVATGREVFHHNGEERVLYHAAFSPDGRRLATTWREWKDSPPDRMRWEHWVSIWDLETGQERLHLDVPLAAALAFSPDGRRPAGGLSAAWSSPGQKSEVRVWDAATGETILTRAFAHALVNAVTYNGDGTLLAAAVGDVGDAGVVKVLDAASGQERLSFAGSSRHDLEAGVQSRRAAAGLAGIVPDASVGGEAVGPRRRPGAVDPEVGRSRPGREQRARE